MTSAIEATPPQELFRELTDLGNLVFSMLTGPQVTVRRWPAYYAVYLEFDRVCQDVNRTTGYLSQAFTRPDDKVDAGRIEAVNACLARIDQSFRRIVDLLARMESRRLVDSGKPALQQIVRTYFAEDSSWYLAFQSQYRSGRVAADGHFLERSVLLLDPYHPDGLANADGTNLVQRQTFELTSERSRTVLGRTARQVQVRLNQVYAALGNFFVEHCAAVTDLLHPSLM
jgi:hypothetical protein